MLERPAEVQQHRDPSPIAPHPILTLWMIAARLRTSWEYPLVRAMTPSAQGMESPAIPGRFIDKYAGKFDQGWDAVRKEIHANQLRLGIIPTGTLLSERIPEIPAWDSLPEEERRLYARQMEVFAAQLEFCDAQIGRVVDTLERIGELDNTLIFVTSDNGASGEGGLAGTFNETYVLNGLQTPLKANLRHLDNWGRTNTYRHYHAGWAMAGNTPFKYFKQAEHRGG